ncbi:MAG: ADP-ribosylglycohydrolase family protein [Planctomycetota bacterium]
MRKERGERSASSPPRIVCSRRRCLATLALMPWGGSLLRADDAESRRAEDDQRRDRVHGLFLGGAVGDAAGGPVEFQSSDQTRTVLPDCRHWPEHRRMSPAEVERLAADLKLLGYARWRPHPEPYGQWQTNAAPGTVTDDTRHKMVLMAALSKARQQGQSLSRRGLAAAYAGVAALPAFHRVAYADLCKEGFHEFDLAAQRVLSAQTQTLPTERIWGGLPTCCGQMTLTPLAAVHAGNAAAAYRGAYRVGFFDQGIAKDINASMVAGLAEALTLPNTSLPDAFARIKTGMLHTDPYRYNEIPFIQRPIALVIDTAERCVDEAKGSPKDLYAALSGAFRPRYYWEADYVLGSSWALLRLCQWNGLAAIHLAMDMGHDTDSVAQVIGQFWGAVVGGRAFPAHLREPVEVRLQEDYGIDLSEWVEEVIDG